MTFEQLFTLLKSTGYPVAYSHFLTAQKLPFITFIDDGSDNFYADNQVFVEGTTINIELYTQMKDLIAEKKIKDILQANDLPYTQLPTTYIDSEKAYQVVFVITLIGG